MKINMKINHRIYRLVWWNYKVKPLAYAVVVIRSLNMLIVTVYSLRFLQQELRDSIIIPTSNSLLDWRQSSQKVLIWLRCSVG